MGCEGLADVVWVFESEALGCSLGRLRDCVAAVAIGYNQASHMGSFLS